MTKKLLLVIVLGGAIAAALFGGPYAAYDRQLLQAHGNDHRIQSTLEEGK